MAPRRSGKVQEGVLVLGVACTATQAPLIRPKATSPRSIVFAGSQGAAGCRRRPGPLHLDFAFLFTVPVGDPIRLDLDEHDVRRVDALVEPTI